MDVAKYIARLRDTAGEHAVGSLKRGPSAEGDVSYYFGWQCGFQAGIAQAEQTLGALLDEEREQEEAQ